MTASQLQPKNRSWVAALCVLAALLPACSSTPSQPEPAPLPGVQARSDVPEMARKWTLSAGPVDAALGAAVVGTRVIVATASGALLELDADKGQMLSRVQLPAAPLAGVGSDGVRHAVITSDHVLRVFQAGQPMWQQRLGASAYTAPLVAGERVFVQTADRGVAAYDGATGRRLWSFARAADAALVLKQPGVLVAVGDTLLAGHGGRLSALNPSTGQIKWDVLVGSSRGTNEVERLVDLVAGHARQGQTLCVRSFQAAVACVDAAKGQVLWSRASQGHTGLSGDESRLFGSESDGHLQAWARGDGQLLWRTDAYRFRALSAPQAWANAVVVGDAQGFVHLLDRDSGRTVARHATDGSALVHPPFVAGRVLVTVNRSGLITGWHLSHEDRKLPQ